MEMTWREYDVVMLSYVRSSCFIKHQAEAPGEEGSKIFTLSDGSGPQMRFGALKSTKYIKGVIA